MSDHDTDEWRIMAGHCLLAIGRRNHKRRSPRLATDVDQTLPESSTTKYLWPVTRPDDQAYRVEDKKMDHSIGPSNTSIAACPAISATR